MEIHIRIQRPLLTLAIFVGVALWISGVFGGSLMNGIGGTGNRGALVASAQESIDREKIKKALLEQREDILRYHLKELEDEAMRSGQSPDVLQRLSDNRAILLALIKEREQADKMLVSSLEQLWEAQGTEFASGRVGSIRLRWPVEPKLGISAHFDDAEYKDRFGFDHHAIDIPTAEGTIIRASADGVVQTVALNGLGYSYIVVSHSGGFQTINGHIKGALVKEGDRVSAGDPIALSNGTPGGKGSGLVTTGQHDHFAVRKDGKLVDPMLYLSRSGDTVSPTGPQAQMGN